MSSSLGMQIVETEKQPKHREGAEKLEVMGFHRHSCFHSNLQFLWNQGYEPFVNVEGGIDRACRGSDPFDDWPSLLAPVSLVHVHVYVLLIVRLCVSTYVYFVEKTSRYICRVAVSWSLEEFRLNNVNCRRCSMGSCVQRVCVCAC